MVSRFVILRSIALLILLSFSTASMPDDSSTEAARKKAFEELEFETGGCQAFLNEQKAQFEAFNKTAAKAAKVIQNKDARIKELEQQLAQQSSELSKVNSRPLNCDAEKNTISDLTSQVAALNIEKKELAVLLVKLKEIATKGKDANEKNSVTLNSRIKDLEYKVAQLTNENAELSQANARLKANQAIATTESKTELKTESAPARRATISATPETVVTAPASVNKAVSNNEKPLKRIHVTSASATSRYNHTRSAIKAFDRDIGTSWATPKQRTLGQSIKATWDEEVTVEKVNITVPEAKTSVQLKRLNFVFADGTTQVIDVEKKWGTYRINLKPTKTNELTIEFEENYLSDSSQGKGLYIVVPEIDIFGR